MSSDRPYAFSPLPQLQEEDDSETPSFSIEMPPSIQADDDQLRASEDGIESSCAVYTKLAFIALVIPYNILTCNLPSPKIALNPNSFAISNFTIFYSRLSANWEADFTFGCSSYENEDGRIYYDRVKGYIFYNEGDKDVLSTSVSIEPFNLGAKEQRKLNVEFGHTGWEGNQPIVREEVANEIGEKLVEHGVLNMGVRLDIWVRYRKWGLFWKNSLLGLPDSYCWDLVVEVMPETGKGRLIVSRPKHCYELYYSS